MKRKTKLTRTLLSLELLEDRCCLSSLPLGTPLAQPDAATQARIGEAYGQLPLSFVANQGQTDAQVNFTARGSGYTLYLTPGEAVLDLQKPGKPGVVAPGDALHMQLVGANPAPAVVGLDQQAATTNYLIGNDPGQWHTQLANYGKVQYQGVYPGIDLVYYGNQRQLEYDFIVAPGANPNAIALSFQGAESMTLDSHGDLVLHTATGDVLEHAPVIYQEIADVRHEVTGNYLLDGSGQVRFQVGVYETTRPLVIDPLYALVYSTYLGGSGSDYG